MTTTPLPTPSAQSRLPIICGHAKLPWAESVGRLQAGWAIPGGGRTSDEMEARTIAAQMHELMQVKETSK